jgi:hypothetical protein
LLRETGLEAGRTGVFGVDAAQRGAFLVIHRAYLLKKNRWVMKKDRIQNNRPTSPITIKSSPASGLGAPRR